MFVYYLTICANNYQLPIFKKKKKKVVALHFFCSFTVQESAHHISLTPVQYPHTSILDHHILYKVSKKHT